MAQEEQKHNVVIIIGGFIVVLIAAGIMFWYAQTKKTAVAAPKAAGAPAGNTSGQSTLSKAGDALGKALGMSGGGGSTGGGGGGSSAKGPLTSLIDNLFGLKKNPTTTPDSSSPTGTDSIYSDGSYTQGDTYYDKDGNPKGHIDAEGNIYGNNGSFLGNTDGNDDGMPSNGQVADEYAQQQQEEEAALTDPYAVSDPGSTYYNPESAYYDASIEEEITGTGSSAGGNTYVAEEDPNEVSNPDSEYYDPNSVYYDQTLDYTEA
jgi:hypothetical protein